ncbi:Pyruvate/2-oxoglutarate dehydrogenase complex, dihydrolipoamide acyltransferase (E2) component or related enzyme [Halanaeroarchaeum sp. HSR-CO]|uniref:2-oxo acid dehydrogenase subunit E2 n=1 Tax=Halanaeroarchaeum sp. HSR-CO TaxID=2866382 RepID=UPI00217DAA93|nr:2-oxo acid dehydrogenase subunit E2 [Halanaeroarchaeum sp. HSR-CO]UWG48949.1 Pyruvate/2-oxoglutarate dehydrogenase complex, dihydrolipoamide acyltransferase (E2) component or related enzyme [Halanaeroarchaeum sp. HSR-CO]
MGYIVRMPKLGLEMKEGTVLEWHVDVSGEVGEEEPLLDIESEKTTKTVETREAGVLREVFVQAGTTVEPGAPLGIVASQDADVEELIAEAEQELDTGEAVGSAEPADATAPSNGGGSATSTEAAAGDQPDRVSPRAQQRADELGVSLAGVEGTGPGGAVTAEDVEAAAEAGAAEPRVSPRAQQRADELGVDLATVEGTGPDGAITAEDVEAAAEAGEPAQEAPAGAATRTVTERETFSGMRSTIARRLGESYRNAVHVTVHRSADATALREATAAADDAFAADVSMTDLLLAALSETLSEYPAFNATYEDGEHIRYEEHNINVAVDVDAGLVTPVVPAVDEKSIGQIATVRREKAEKTLAGEYTMDDLSGGTFTVSNLGHLGVESFDPIINPPQIAILGVDALDERVTVEDGTATSRPILPLDLSFDHRVVDGADAARFLDALVERLEDPWSLLVGDQGDTSAEASGTASTTDVPTAFEDAPRRAVTINEPGTEGTFSLGEYEYPFGIESAPTPPEIFLGSLQSCLALTLRNVAMEAGHELGKIDVDGAIRPESGSVEAVELLVVVDAPSVDDETLTALVDEAESQCHVALLLREDLPVEISVDRP